MTQPASLSPIEFLYFDLGNVLLHFSHERGCEQLASIANRPASAIRHTIFTSGLEDRYESGDVDDATFCETIREQLACNVSDAEILQATSDIFWPNVGMLPVVAHLKTAGYRMGVLSNTCSSHWSFVTTGRNWFIQSCFEIHLLSFEARSMKPDPRIYALAAAQARVEPSQIFFTDDRPENVAAAQQAGWQAVVFKSSTQIIRELWSRGIRSNL